MITLIAVLLAILALSFLIFIHELGHYWAARRVGMRVETFSIGFGPALYRWESKGVEWRISCLPFGGYVKIAEGDEEGIQDPYAISDGFFGRSPWQRIFVSLAGPCANLLFALLALTLLYLIGGREKAFGEMTSYVGWIDPKSALYEAGLRPGDRIVSYNDTPVRGQQDHIISAMTSSQIDVQAIHYDPQTGQPSPLTLTIAPYPHPLAAHDKEIMTTGVLQPASYLMYHPEGQLTKNSLAEGSPLLSSGIQDKDLLVWANGERIFSQLQLTQLLARDTVLLTIQRSKEILLRRAPRVRVQDLKLTTEQREELTDWQYESLLHTQKISKLYIIPYNLSSEAVVESPLSLIDPEQQQHALSISQKMPIDALLQVGDRIIAVQGKPIHHSYELLSALQEPTLLMIVERPMQNPVAALTTSEADLNLHEQFPQKDLEHILQGIGRAKSIEESGLLKLLAPVTPKTHQAFAITPELEKTYAQEMLEQRTKLQQIHNRDERSAALQQLEEAAQRLHLGPPYFIDQVVYDNPPPLTLFYNICAEIFRTLQALVTGNLSPKWLSGPVGMIQVVQESGQAGISHALYWLALISINLGLLNLLPIPMLDGGSICFSLFEAATGKQLPPKVLEKFIAPFAVMLIILILFLTYQDLMRLIQRFFFH